jgi:hypothetical protein
MMDFSFFFKPWIRSSTYSYTPFCFPTPGRGFNGCRSIQWAETWELTEDGKDGIAALVYLSFVVAVVGTFVLISWSVCTLRKRMAQLKQRFPNIANEDYKTLVGYHPAERLASLVSAEDVTQALAWTRAYKILHAANPWPRVKDVDLIIAHMRPEKISEIRDKLQYERALTACEDLVYRQEMFI